MILHVFLFSTVLSMWCQPHCSLIYEHIKARPGALCCVSLPLFLIPFPVASSAVLSIIMKKKDTYWCTRSCAYVLWITAGCFSSPLLSCKAFSYRFVACLRNVPLGWSIMTAGHSRHHSVNIWHFIACLLICSFLHSCLFNPFFCNPYITHWYLGQINGDCDMCRELTQTVCGTGSLRCGLMDNSVSHFTPRSLLYTLMSGSCLVQNKYLVWLFNSLGSEILLKLHTGWP